jgi:hypothetical protein
MAVEPSGAQADFPRLNRAEFRNAIPTLPAACSSRSCPVTFRRVPVRKHTRTGNGIAVYAGTFGEALISSRQSQSDIRAVIATEFSDDSG